MRLVVVPPGQIALVVAHDGALVRQDRVLGREVACATFHADALLHGGR